LLTNSNPEYKQFQADALEELGLILLQEGQLWESEECYASAYECFKTAERDATKTRSYHNHCMRNFAMWGIAAGHQLWSRYAGLARNGSFELVERLIEWKHRRTPLPKVPRPDYAAQRVADVWIPYHLEDVGLDDDEDEETVEQIMALMKSRSSRFTDRESSVSDISATQLAQPAESSSHVTVEGDVYQSDMNHDPDEDEEKRKALEKKRSSRKSLKSKKSEPVIEVPKVEIPVDGPESPSSQVSATASVRSSSRAKARASKSIIVTPSVSGSDSSLSPVPKRKSTTTQDKQASQSQQRKSTLNKQPE